MKINEVGRSMLEMLGVLAIVGVLSVGGVAGYSKAMTSYKMNKLLGEYTDFFSDVLRYKEDWCYERRIRDPEGYAANSLFKISAFLDDVIKLPNGWSGDGPDEEGIYDSLGGLIYVYVRRTYLQFDIFLSSSKSSKADADAVNKCRVILQRLLKEYVDDFHWVVMYHRSVRQSDYFYGSRFCHEEGNKCYSDITLDEINSMCGVEVEDVSGLAITVKMY